MIRRQKKKSETEETVRRVPVTRYSPDYRKGLSSEQVKERRRHGWANEAVEPRPRARKKLSGATFLLIST